MPSFNWTIGWNCYPAQKPLWISNYILHWKLKIRFIYGKIFCQITFGICYPQRRLRGDLIWNNEPLTLHCHFVNWEAQLMSHEANDTKDHKSSKEAGKAVPNGHHKCISEKKGRQTVITFCDEHMLRYAFIVYIINKSLQTKMDFYLVLWNALDKKMSCVGLLNLAFTVSFLVMSARHKDAYRWIDYI